MKHHVLKFTAALLVTLGHQVASAGVVFNWVNERPPIPGWPDYTSLRGLGRVEVSNDVYLAAQSSSQSFGQYVTRIVGPVTQIGVFATSSDVSYVWRQISTGQIVPIEDCSASSLSCFPIFSSTKVLFANIAFDPVERIFLSSDWADYGRSTPGNPQLLHGLTLVGSTLKWNIAVTDDLPGMASGLEVFGLQRYGIRGVPGMTGRWVLDASTLPAQIPVPATLALLMIGFAAIRSLRYR